MSADLQIRLCKVHDLPRLHVIRAAAFAPVFASFRSIVGEEIAPIAFAKAEIEQAKHLDGLLGPESQHEVYAGLVNGEIVGFCAVGLDQETKIGEIDLSAVHPDHAGQGVGERMFVFALERMKAVGMTVATVGTGGDPAHAPARRAYEKVGFARAVPGVYYYQKL